MVYGIPYDPIPGQGEGHGSLKCVKMADIKGYLLYSNAHNQKTYSEL